jgi:AcrR family transcriptional regulator
MATRTHPTPTGTDPVSPEDLEVVTDGRLLRRERNREAVVEALLDLYREGNLRPSTEEIATRSGLSPRSLFRYFDDVDDLTRTAVRRQHERAQHLVAIGAGPDEPLAHRVDTLVTQRFRLFAAVGNAAAVARLRAPFQPVLDLEVRRNRAFLRAQIAELFAPELAGMAEDRAAAALAATDVLTSFESCRLLLGDQALSAARARAVVAVGLLAILGPSR